MLTVDAVALVTAIVAVAISLGAFLLAYSQHRRDGERRADERLERDSAQLSWRLVSTRTGPTRLRSSAGERASLYVDNGGAEARRVEVKLERNERPTKRFSVPIVKRGTPVRCGEVDVDFPMPSFSWSLTATWYDDREPQQIDIWVLTDVEGF